MSNWADYIKGITGDARQEEVAVRVGVKQSTVSRWLRGQTIPGDTAVVALLAQEYGRNPVEAFIAAGMLDLDDWTDGALASDSVALLIELGIEDGRTLHQDDRDTRGA